MLSKFSDFIDDSDDNDRENYPMEFLNEQTSLRDASTQNALEGWKSDYIAQEFEH